MGTYRSNMTGNRPHRHHGLEHTDSGCRLFRFGMNSDLKITCGEKSWDVHTAIICPRSAFFAKVCWHQSLVGSPILFRPWVISHTRQVIASHHIVLRDDEPWALHKMLRYLYILEYFTLPDDYARFKYGAEINTDVQMFLLGQKYGIEDLQKMAGDRYQRSLRAYLVGFQANSLHENVSFHPHCSDEYADEHFFIKLSSVLELLYRPAPDNTQLLRGHTTSVIRDILRRWSHLNVYQDSMYGYLGAYLRCVFQALLEELAKNPPWDFSTLAERVNRWRDKYVATQKTWMQEHNSAWGEDWGG